MPPPTPALDCITVATPGTNEVSRKAARKAASLPQVPYRQLLSPSTDDSAFTSAWVGLGLGTSSCPTPNTSKPNHLYHHQKPTPLSRARTKWGRKRPSSYYSCSWLAELLLVAVTLVYMAVMVGANGICLAAYGERGCGVSLDYSLTYTLPGGDVNQRNHTVVSGETKWNDPSYISDSARLVRHRCLLGMSLMECDFGRRLVLAAIGGGIIGFERRSADRPAGVRVMSLVSLGSAIFTLCSTWGFLTGPQEWDASRISAAIPSGVGFLGAGLIWKGTQEGTGHHTVHGITTAASVWISASVGISCGGGLYFPAITGATLCIFVLRYGPRLYMGERETEKESECAELLAWGDMEESATMPTQDIPRPQRVQQLRTGHVRPVQQQQQQQRRESWTDARAFFDGAEEHVVPFPGSVRAGANSCGDPRAALDPSASAGTDSRARRESKMSLASARPSLGRPSLGSVRRGSFLHRRPAHAHVFDCES